MTTRSDKAEQLRKIRLEETQRYYRTEQESLMDEATNKLSSFFMFTVGLLVVIYIGYWHHGNKQGVEREYFSLPDQCGVKENEANDENIQYGLESLEMVREAELKVLPATQHLTTPLLDLANPAHWVQGGDSITQIAGSYWVVSVDTPMSGVSGGQLRAWFQGVNCSGMYGWWHPQDHEYGVWVRHGVYPATSPLVARQGMIHRVKERIGGKLQQLDILFQDPCAAKDCTSLAASGVELVLSGRVNAHLPPLGRVYSGYFIHTLRVRGQGQSTLHSRFVLGKDVGCMDPTASPWGCYLFAKVSSVVNKVLLAEHVAQAVFVHCKEEMFTLGRLIAKMNGS